jgi:pyruvate,water dikinase
VVEAPLLDEDRPALALALSAWPAEARFAVRSSALDEDAPRHSFAGVHETILAVPRDQVVDAVARCMASLYAPRALAYRLRHGLPTSDLRMTVLVQRMVPSRAAGVAFTVNHVLGADDECLVNVAWGLGEGVVSGLCEPDEIRLDKRTGQIRSMRIGAKRHRAEAWNGRTRLSPTERTEQLRLCLTPAQLVELTELLHRVEVFFGAPRDVEFCHDGDRFWILQARPLTAQASPVPGGEWTRANLAEILPELPCPQVVEANVRLLDRAMRHFYGSLLAPPERVGPCVESFCGRPYFNLSQLRALCAATGTSPATVLEGLGHVQSIRAADRANPRPSLRSIISNLPSFARMAVRQIDVARRTRLYLRALRRLASSLHGLDPASASDGEARRVLGRYDALAQRSMEVSYALGAMTVYKLMLERLLAAWWADIEGFVSVTLAAGPKTVSAQQGFDLLALAAQAAREPVVRAWLRAARRSLRGGDEGASFRGWRGWLRNTLFIGAFEAFLARYGHRGPYESDWSFPRYSEDPAPLLFSLAEMLGDGVSADDLEGQARGVIERQRTAAARAWEALADSVPARSRGAVLALARGLVGRVGEMYRLRELNRSEFARVEAAFRRWHLALAERFVSRGWLDRPEDYFYLTLEEVRHMLAHPSPGARRLVARRRAERAALSRVEMPLVGSADDLWTAVLEQGTVEGEAASEQHLPSRAPARWEGAEARGLCLSPGAAEAEVVVVSSPRDFARMRKGAVLVAPATDPSWIPLFALASALIVEVGGTLSHAATVAREYGLPAVANIPGATRILREGDRVRVDASRGLVRIVSRAADLLTVSEG